MIRIDLNSLEGSQKFKTQGFEEKSKKCEKKGMQSSARDAIVYCVGRSVGRSFGV